MYSFSGCDHFSRSTEDLKLRAEEVEGTLMEHEAIQKETSKHVLARVERLSKEKVEKEEEHA